MASAVQPAGGVAARESHVFTASARMPSTTAARGPAGAGPAGALVSDIFEDTDVRQALQILASQAKASLVIDERVSGSVSAVIENEPFETALVRLLLPLGYVYRFRDGQYFVGSADPDSALFDKIADRAEFQPKHFSSQELVSLLPDKHRQFLRIVDKRNLIIIEAPRDTLESIVQQLQQADQPVPQVVLEAIVCVVNPESGFRFGMDWNHGIKIEGFDALNLGFNGLSFGGSVSPIGANNAFNDFAVTSAFVKLLAENGYLSIRAAPRVMAKDGEKAEISIARETFFSLQPSNTQFLFRQDVERVEAGIGLQITPTIRGENITVHIEKAEVSEDIRTADVRQDVANNPFPLINRRRVSTTVSVRDGQTIVIGGLVQRQLVDRVSRIPGLGRIPGIGRLFTIVEQQEREAEVVILIAPRLVHPLSEECPTPHAPVLEAASSVVSPPPHAAAAPPVSFAPRS